MKKNDAVISHIHGSNPSGQDDTSLTGTVITNMNAGDKVSHILLFLLQANKLYTSDESEPSWLES